MRQGTLLPEYPHTPSSAEIIGELHEQAYAELPFGMGHAERDELFVAFRNFVDICSEPGGKKLEDAVKFTVRKDNGEYFLNYRRPGEINPHEPDRAPGTDHKYIFHYGAQTIERAKQALG